MSTSPAPLSFEFALRSDVGLVRENNEDSAYAQADRLIIADGMGGHSSGEVASTIAVHTYVAVPTAGPESLFAAATRTREVLRRLSDADETLETMGTTIVALCQAEGGYHVCHIGDSRMYRLRDGALTQITTDHTHVQHLVETGRITRDEVPTHPYRAMLLKSLDDQPGGSAPDIIPVDLQAGDRVLLCSDGLSDYVPEHVIAEILQGRDLEAVADELIDTSFRAGTRDNVTVIVADVVPASGSSAQFAGAVADGLTLSRPAREALSEVDPEGMIPLEVRAETISDPLTRPGPPVEPEASPSEEGFGRAGIYAALAVAVLTVAVALLL